METFDFVVIGAGIAGSSVAYELARHGRVVVLEREQQPGYHSTGRSAALLTENYGNEVIRRLTIASRRFFRDPPAGFADHDLLSPRGVLWLARDDQCQKLEEALPGAQALVPSIHDVDGERARALCPALKTGYVAKAIYEPDAMDLDVSAIHQGYLRGLRQRGGEVVTDAEVTSLSRTAGVWTVESRAGRWQTSVIVNAAGAWCDQIAELSGARAVGIVPKRRTAFTFDPPPNMEVAHWPIAIDIDEQFYFKPEAGRILASPADETPVAPQDVQPEEIDVALAVERVEEATIFRIRRLVSRWAGLRSFAPDKTPVVGMDPEIDGFFWLAGQGGYGIMTAPALAVASAELIVAGAVPADLGLSASQLSPERLHHG